MIVSLRFFTLCGGGSESNPGGDYLRRLAVQMNSISLTLKQPQRDVVSPLTHLRLHRSTPPSLTACFFFFLVMNMNAGGKKEGGEKTWLKS